MLSMRLSAWPLFASVLLVASCSESNPVAAPDDLPTAQFSAANAPAQSGPNVFRLGFAAVVLSGFDTDLAVAVGFNEPFADHCNDFESANQPGRTQIVLPPSGGINFKASGQDVSVLVFAFSGAVFDNCLLVGAPLVASGTAHTNGGFGPRQGSSTLHGVVDLVGGGQASLLVTSITHFAPDGSIVFDHTRIRLTPL
jgi:hypothetical protein